MVLGKGFVHIPCTGRDFEPFRIDLRIKGQKIDTYCRSDVVNPCKPRIGAETMCIAEFEYHRLMIKLLTFSASLG
jgi:hypothetical protein